MPQLPQHDPLNIPATRREINALRDELESAQVIVNGVPVDIHERAEKRMQEAIDLWAIIGRQSISWTMGDNSEITLSRQDLISLLTEAKQIRAIRGLSLHTTAKAMKNDPSITQRDIANWKEAVLSAI